MEEQQVTHTSSITLKKGVKKDSYGWDIRVAGDDLKKATEEIKEIDNLLLGKFGKEKKE